MFLGRAGELLSRNSVTCCETSYLSQPTQLLSDLAVGGFISHEMINRGGGGVTSHEIINRGGGGQGRIRGGVKFLRGCNVHMASPGSGHSATARRRLAFNSLQTFQYMFLAVSGSI